MSASTVAFAWAGRTWRARDSAGAAQQPGPCVWSANNVTVDSSGYLHLQIAPPGTSWTAAEVYLNGPPLGYGTYAFDVQTNLHAQDPFPVLGLSTLQNDPANGFANVVMEASKFGLASRTDDVQASVANLLTTRFSAIRPTPTRFAFTWLPGLVRYTLTDLTTGETYFRWDATQVIPHTAAEQLAINFWLSGGTGTADGLGREVVLTNFTFTEADMGLGSITLGRLTLTEYYDAAESFESDRRRLVVTGQESMPPLADAASVRQRGADLMAMEGQQLSALFTTKTDRDGFYLVDSPQVTYSSYGDQATMARWSVTLVRLGDTAGVEFESRLVGGQRVSFYPALTAERWHAPPIGAGYYYTGSTQPTSIVRTGAYGNLTVYRNVPATADPRWGITPSDWLGGAPTIIIGGVTVAGLTCLNTPTSWSIDNGLIKISARVATGTVQLQVWEPASGTWSAPKVIDVLMGTTSMGAMSYISVLRNDPEEVAIRLVRTIVPGRALLDITLKRGARHASFLAQRRDSGTIAVQPTVAEAGTDSTKGYVFATGNDADGNQLVIGMPVQATVTAASCAIANTVPGIAVPFFVGEAVGGTAAQAGDTVDDLAKQYLGDPSAITRVVRR